MPQDFPLSRVVAIAAAKDRELLGSGFRLSARRVLTARHVVGDRPEVYVCDPAGAKWAEPLVATAVWPPKGVTTGLDAVLLETPPVVDVSPWAAFLDERLGAATEFEAYGYPDAWHNPAQRKALLGKAAAFGRGDQSFELVIEGGYPDEVDEWAGVSGAAILCRLAGSSGWTLAGLVKRGYYKYEGRSLQAVPLPALLAAPGFRAALERLDPDERQRTYLRRVAEFLTPVLAEALAARNERWSEIWRESKDLERLARAVCLESKAVDTTKGVLRTHDSLLEQGRRAEADQLWQLFWFAVPSAILNQGQATLVGREATHLKLEGRTSVAAELKSAAVDGRRAQFNEPTGPAGRSLPRPVYEVPLTLDRGIDPEGEQGLKDMAESLGVALAFDGMKPGSLDDLAMWPALLIGLCQFDKGLAVALPQPYREQFGFDQLDLEGRRQRYLDLINEHIEDLAETGARFFSLVDGSTPDGAELMRKLELWLHQLRLVEVADPAETSSGETQINRALLNSYLKRGQASEKKS